MSDETTRRILTQFDAAFKKHDPSLLDGLLAEDCILENSGPAPDGSVHVGRAACLEFWSGIAANTDMNFETEDFWFGEERGIMRWRLRWGPGEADTVRGVNLMIVRDGQIVEGRGYVKG